MILQFDANRPKAACRKTAPTLTKDAVSLAQRIDAIGRLRPAALGVFEDMAERYEQKLEIRQAQ